MTPAVFMWRVADKLRPGSTNLCTTRLVPEQLDHGALREALALMFDRHEILRCAISRSRERHVGWRRLYLEHELIPAVSTDLVPDIEAVPSLTALRTDDAPFKLSAPPLLRVRTTTDGAKAIGITVPHAAADMLSMHILMRDLQRIYESVVNGTEARLPPVAGFGHHARSLYELPATVRQRHEAFWTDELQTYEPPSGSSLGTGDNGKGEAVDEVLAQDDLPRLLGRHYRVTPFAIVLTAFARAIFSVFRVQDLIVQTPFVNRPAGTMNDVGCYANLLALRLRHQGEESFVEMARRSGGVINRAFAHGRLGALEAFFGAGAIPRFDRPRVILRLWPMLYGARTAEKALSWKPLEPPPPDAMLYGTNTSLLLDVRLEQSTEARLSYATNAVTRSAAVDTLTAMREDLAHAGDSLAQRAQSV